MVVLAVHRHQAPPQLAQLAGVGRTPVDARGSALSKFPLEYKRVAAGLEDAFDSRLVGAMADLVGPAAPPDREAQRVDDQRFAASGFAGEQVEAGAKPDP